MVEFESELGKTNFSHGERRVLTVEDPSDEAVSQQSQQVRQAPAQRTWSSGTREVPTEHSNDQPYQRKISPGEMERLQREREQKRAGTYMSSEAKKRVEYLLGLGRLYKDVDISGVKFTLQTLKNIEMKDVSGFISADELNAAQFGYELRTQILARAICEIDGVPIEQVIGQETIEYKIEFVNELDEALVTHLNDEYQALVDDAKNQYSENKKEAAKEIVEEIKKS